MNEYEIIYKGTIFEDSNIKPYKYCDDYFDLEIREESNLFFENRLANNILPNRLNESSERELQEIKKFFNENRDTFYFLFDENDAFIGSVLWLKNYIQSLLVVRKYQRKGFGEKLTKFAINNIMQNGYDEIKLNVLLGNEPALMLYKKIGFEIIQE
jgi:ribosomal protein S18 acetylase RimI-like enzyme